MLAHLIVPGEPVALLDYPQYANAGDVLIWAGTREYLAQLGIVVRYQERHDRYSATVLRARHPSGPILLQGGGNFGDRWPPHQAFRERVIADFPDRRIIQLPQTMEMSQETAVRVRDVYARHPRLTILLRDSVSMRSAESLLSGLDVRFCPDLAFGYSPARPPRPVVDVVEVKRRDSESVVAESLFRHEESISTTVTDWALSRSTAVRWRMINGPGALSRGLGHRVTVLHGLDVRPPYGSWTRLVLHDAERTIGQGRVVVTDRLHAAVLAALMGIPVVARDNVNGKVSAIVGDYLGQFDTVTLADDPDTATREVHAALRNR
jgi:pyruvyl transferase EpsO